MTLPADDNVIHLPPRPSASEAKAAPKPAQDAERATRVRARGTWKPAAPQVSKMLSGVSLLDAEAASIMAIWAAHHAAASYYQAWAVKVPRWMFGAWHAFALVPLLRLVEHATDSPPKFAGTAAVVVVILFLLHAI